MGCWDVMTRPKAMGGLGFRVLEFFNLSHLVRQSLRIIQDHSSLSARILKAFYFANSSLLEALLGSHPSQIWRSIVEGRGVLVQGLIRRIGDGWTTEIRGHTWHPREGTMRPIIAAPTSNLFWVSDLIEIRDTFLAMDVSIILSIPLCTRNIPNFWSWAFEKKKFFFYVINIPHDGKTPDWIVRAYLFLRDS